MAGFKFFLDGSQVGEPEGFQDFEEEIVRDEEKRIIRYDFPLQLTFVGTGYEAIEAKYQENYNAELQLVIIDARQPAELLFLKAVIKLSNCTFNISAFPKESVVCEIDDSVYQASIFQNLKRPIGIGGTESLNGLSIMPITTISLVVFDTADGANNATIRTAYDLKDAFAYALQFITDGAVGFESDWYDDLPDDEKLCIITGIALRNPALSQLAPVISFERLFQEAWKKYNLYLIVQDPYVNPVVRLEQESYMYADADIVLELDDIQGLTRFLDTEKLYNRITIGSSNAIRELGTTYPMFYLPFLSFVEEEYNITGVINVDRELNLLSQWIIDTNTIENIIDGNDDQDDDIVMIQYTQSTSTATKGTYFPTANPANRLYNEQLVNSNVAQRFNSLGEIVLNSGLLTASFQAQQTTDINASGPLNLIGTSATTVYDENAFPFEDDSTPPNFDTGGNYDISNYEFTAPVTGFYRFRFDLGFVITTFITDTTARLRFRPVMSFRIDGSTVVTPTDVQVASYDGSTRGPFIGFQQQVIGFSNLNVGSGRWLRVERTILLEVGQTITAKLYAEANIYNTTDSVALFNVQFSNSIFANPMTPISGGVYFENDPNSYYVGVYEANEINITDDQWQSLKDNPTGIIRINTGQNDNRKTYIRNIKRKLIQGESEISLIFNRNQIIK